MKRKLIAALLATAMVSSMVATTALADDVNVVPVSYTHLTLPTKA